MSAKDIAIYFYIAHYEAAMRTSAVSHGAAEPSLMPFIASQCRLDCARHMERLISDAIEFHCIHILISPYAKIFHAPRAGEEDYADCHGLKLMPFHLLFTFHMP